MRPNAIAKLDSPLTLTEILMNLGEATSFFTDDGKVHDQTEFYEACCKLLGMPMKTEAYVEVITITNASAFVSGFIKYHRKDIIDLGWLNN